VANGAVVFTKLAVQAEYAGAGTAWTSATAAYGTAAFSASGGRRVQVTPVGVLDLGRTFDTGADRSIGVRNPLLASRVTQTSENPTINIDAPAVTTDELAVWTSMIQAPSTGGTPAGTAAPYTWTTAVGMTSAAVAPVSYQAIVGDGNQSWWVRGILPQSFSIGASSDGVTQVSLSCFAKSAGTCVASTESLPATTQRLMPGRLWTAAYGTAFLSAGTAGGTTFSTLFDWKLDISSGITPINAQAGSLQLTDFNQFGGPIAGALNITIASNPAAISVLYASLGSKTFWRFHWEDTQAVAHSADVLVCAVPTKIDVINGDKDGLTTYQVSLDLAYDETSSQSVTLQVKNSLALLP
jgi:hypothetical protein